MARLGGGRQRALPERGNAPKAEFPPKEPPLGYTVNNRITVACHGDDRRSAAGSPAALPSQGGLLRKKTAHPLTGRCFLVYTKILLRIAEEVM